MSRRGLHLRLGSVLVLLGLLAACGGETAAGGGDAAGTDAGTQAAAGTDAGTQATAGQDCDEPVRIGAMSPMSGQYANWGDGWTKSAQLAIDQWNADGGVLGCEVVAVFEDDEGDATAGASAANKLATEGVSGIVGPIFSGVTLAAGPILEEAGVPFLVGSSAVDVTEQGWQNVFRLAFREDRSGPFDAQMALDQGYTTGVVVHDNTAFAQGLAEQFVQAFEADGGTVTTEVIVPGESDYSATLTSVRDQDPEFVYYSGYYAEGGQLVRQGKELGMTDVGWLFGNSNQDDEFLEIAGDAAEGILMGTWTPPTLETNDIAQEYVAAYNEAYGEDPSSLFHWAYDGVNVLLETIEQTGSADPAAVAEGLRSGEYEVTSGTISYDEKGDRGEQPLGVLTVEDGEFALAGD